MTHRRTLCTLALALAAAATLIAVPDGAGALEVRLDGADAAVDPPEVAAVLPSAQR